MNDKEKIMNAVINEESMLIKAKGREYVRIYLQDIYYFEKRKGTHYCMVYYQDGETCFRASVRELEEQLGDVFLKVSASTLINRKKVRGINDGQRRIYFQKNLYCTYAGKILYNPQAIW